MGCGAFARFPVMMTPAPMIRSNATAVAGADPGSVGPLR